VCLGSCPRTQFYGTIELDAIPAKRRYSDLVDEVVQLFTTRTGVKVRMLNRPPASMTGCNVLKFKNAELETGE